MTPILLLLLFPLLTVVGMKIWRPENFSWLEAGAQILLTVVVLVGVYQGGRYLEMSSVEYWNGQVNSKTHADGHYQTSYCCATDSKGNCTSTCYTDHYTRDWYLETTVGNITTSYIDTEWRSTRDSFESDRYWNGAYKGEPCSVTNTYLNYVQAAGSSLFNRNQTPPETFAKAGLLLDYPQRHDIYKLNHVHAMGVQLPEIAEWNDTLGKMLRSLGAAKQINIFVIVVNTTDRSYIHAVQQHWRGANKNDAVIAIGSADGVTIQWADVFSWSKKAEFDVAVRNGITAHGKLEKNAILGIIQEATLSDYVRRPMAEYEYLKDEIDPPMWVLVILIILAVPGSLALAWFFDGYDLDARVFGRSSRRRSHNSSTYRRRFRS